MKILEIFDPALCCSTGVCGPEVDPELVRFAGDLDWLGRQGIPVRRYNLAQQPAEFAANPSVRAALESAGADCLPLVLVDGAIATRSIYPTRDQLARLAGLPVPGGAGGAEPSEPRASGCCGSDTACCS